MSLSALYGVPPEVSVNPAPEMSMFAPPTPGMAPPEPQPAPAGLAGMYGADAPPSPQPMMQQPQPEPTYAAPSAQGLANLFTTYPEALPSVVDQSFRLY